MYFNVNFNVFFKLIKVNLLLSELYLQIQLENQLKFNVQTIKLNKYVQTVIENLEINKARGKK